MKKLLLAGAGHSHLVTITNIPRFTRAGVSVTVVGPGDDHYYSGMGPGLLAGMYRPEQTRFAVRRMTEGRGGVFFRDVVERIDAAERQVILSSGQVLEYDLLSCNMGSVVHGLPGDNKNLIPVKPVENLHQAAREIRTRLMLGPVRAAVVGGGAAGVELAANLVRLAATLPNHLDVTLISRDDLLLRHPSRARRVALDSLRKRGVSVLERAAVRQVRESRIDLEQGGPVPFDLAFNASGIEPAPVFRRSGLAVGVDGGLRVDAYLQCVSEPAIYGAGDCIAFAPRPLHRVGVYAVRQGPVLYRNLIASLTGGSREAFRPRSRYLSILNMGDGHGILSWGPVVLSGTLPLLLKDRIDRAFMRRFQGG